MLAEGDAIDWRIVGPLLEVAHDEGYTPPPATLDHGTHVAGILGGSWTHTDDRDTTFELRGVCPDIRLYDIRVISAKGVGGEFAIMSAMQFVRWLNSTHATQGVHGTNLSLSIRHDISNYACGRTPVCEEAERLVAAGVVVVTAAGNLGRYIAADMATPDRRASAIGLVVWGTTVGAVIGPNLTAPAGAVALSLGLPELAGPYGLTVLFIGLAWVVSVLLLRPEPYALADPSALPARTDEQGQAPSLPAILARPSVATALVTLVAAQFVMVLIMTMTPLHLIDHGHGLATVGLVLSAHTFGMFGLSPITGRLTDRFGSPRVIAAGLAGLALAALLAALAPPDGGLLLTLALFLLGAGFMMLETKSIIQLALLWGSTWVVASLAIASVLTMALAANFIVSKIEVRRPWLVGGVLLALLAVNYVLPVGRVGFDSLALESAFYAAMIFSPIVCAGLLFGSAIKHSTSIGRDYGTNLLGAMAGGVGEYLSLVTGFNALLLVIALAYVGALIARRAATGSAARPV